MTPIDKDTLVILLDPASTLRPGLKDFRIRAYYDSSKDVGLYSVEGRDKNTGGWCWLTWQNRALFFLDESLAKKALGYLRQRARMNG